MDERVHIGLFTFADGVEGETIVFGEAARAQRRATSGPVTEVTCRHCQSDLIHPLDWEQTGEDTWQLTLRCPDCEAVYEVALSRYTLERYVAQLHAQKRALARDLGRLEQACFREEMEQLLLLVHEDHLLLADF